MHELGLLNKNGFALDLGCGKGADSADLMSVGYTVISVDNEDHGCKDTLVSDIVSFPIYVDSYDIIICNNVLPFIAGKKNTADILRKIVVGLKQDGIAWFTLYGYQSSFYPNDSMSFFTDDEVNDIVDELPVTFLEKSTMLGIGKNERGETIMQDSYRFLVQKQTPR